MRTKPIIAGAVLIAILVLISIVFITARPSRPPITVRHIKSVQPGRDIELTFEVTNHTTTIYAVFPMFVEVHDGRLWRKCPGLKLDTPSPGVEPPSASTLSLNATNLPVGSSLRLRMDAYPGAGYTFRRRMDAYNRWQGLVAILRRLELRFQGSPISLDKKVFFNVTPSLSDEFVEPEPK